MVKVTCKGGGRARWSEKRRGLTGVCHLQGSEGRAAVTGSGIHNPEEDYGRTLIPGPHLLLLEGSRGGLRGITAAPIGSASIGSL